MSRTNYEAVADFAGHWLHRAQVSLLTGKIGQIKLSHIRKKPWCGPGAGSKTEAAEPASLQDRSRGAGLAPRPKPRSRPHSKTEAAEPASLSRSPTDCDTCGNLCRRGVGVFDTPTSVREVCQKQTHYPESHLRTAGMPRRTCEGALKYNTPAL